MQEALFDFRSGKVQVLVATDVAARGLHIRGLPYIVNYDFPTRLEPYVHRVGRTGRLASSGHAFSFFTRNLAPLAQPLLALLQVCSLSPLCSNPNLAVILWTLLGSVGCWRTCTLLLSHGGMSVCYSVSS